MTPTTRRPNIVLILADDLGFGDIACYNERAKIPTPNIDALAESGVCFYDMHTSSAVCTPSRYGLLTGRNAWRGDLPYGVYYGYEPPLIEPGRLTIAGLLQKSGYRTGCFGKWHLGLKYHAKPGMDVDFAAPYPWPGIDLALEQKIDLTQPVTGGPLACGFDQFFGTSGASTAQPPYAFIDGEEFTETPTEFREKMHFTGRPGMAAPSWDHKDVDPEFTNRALRFIREATSSSARNAESGDDSPFFLYLAASAPHEPCVEATVPAFARRQGDAGDRGDLVWLFDWMVGEVVRTLRETGAFENTLLMVTSDNGALPGDRVRDIRGMGAYELYDHLSCGDYRGYKAHVWEGGHRVPFIASWPGVIVPNRIINTPASLTDLLSTIATIIDSPLPEQAGEDSVVIVEDLTGGESFGAGPAGHRSREAIVHHAMFGVFSVRAGRWKLVLDSEGSGGWPPPVGEQPIPGSPGQLYDLEDDPYETENLFSEKPDLVADLTVLIHELQSAGGTAR